VSLGTFGTTFAAGDEASWRVHSGRWIQNKTFVPVHGITMFERRPVDGNLLLHLCPLIVLIQLSPFSMMRVLHTMHPSSKALALEWYWRSTEHVKWSQTTRYIPNFQSTARMPWTLLYLCSWITPPWVYCC